MAYALGYCTLSNAHQKHSKTSKSANRFPYPQSSTCIADHLTIFILTRSGGLVSRSGVARSASRMNLGASIKSSSVQRPVRMLAQVCCSQNGQPMFGIACHCLRTAMAPNKTNDKDMPRRRYGLSAVCQQAVLISFSQTNPFCSK